MKLKPYLSVIFVIAACVVVSDFFPLPVQAQDNSVKEWVNEDEAMIALQAKFDMLVKATTADIRTLTQKHNEHVEASKVVAKQLEDYLELIKGLDARVKVLEERKLVTSEQAQRILMETANSQELFMRLRNEIRTYTTPEGFKRAYDRMHTENRADDMCDMLLRDAHPDAKKDPKFKTLRREWCGQWVRFDTPTQEQINFLIDRYIARADRELGETLRERFIEVVERYRRG